MTKDQTLMLLAALAAIHVLLCVRLSLRTKRAGLGWAKWFVISLAFSTAVGALLASRRQRRQQEQKAREEIPAAPDDEAQAIRRAAATAAEIGDELPTENVSPPPGEPAPAGEGDETPAARLQEGEGYLFVCPHCRRLVGRIQRRLGEGEIQRCPYCENNLDEANLA